MASAKMTDNRPKSWPPQRAAQPTSSSLQDGSDVSSVSTVSELESSGDENGVAVPAAQAIRDDKGKGRAWRIGQSRLPAEILETYAFIYKVTYQDCN